MNNVLKTTIALIVSIIIILSILIIIKNSNMENRILIEDSAESTAWSYRYYGFIVMTDGTIYDFESEDRDFLSYKTEVREKTKKIMDIGKKRTTNILKKDLTQIQEYINKLNNTDKYNTEKSRNRMGPSDSPYKRIEVYKDGSKIVLNSELPYKVNLNEVTEKLIKIIERYWK